MRSIASRLSAISDTNARGHMPRERMITESVACMSQIRPQSHMRMSDRPPTADTVCQVAPARECTRGIWIQKVLSACLQSAVCMHVHSPNCLRPDCSRMEALFSTVQT